MSRNSIAMAATRRQAAPFWRGLLALVIGLALIAAQAVSAQETGPGIDRPASFADLARKVGDSVVMVTTTTTIAAPEGGPVVPEGSPFEDFFREFGGPNAPRRERRGRGLGSGFIISEDGYVVTNNHVIDGADQIEVQLRDGTRLDATIEGTDPTTDVALLKVDPETPLTAVTFGDSDKVRVGDWVLAMGNPLGQGFSASAGIVSAKGRALQGTYDDFIQTDAAINRGNSGGPLFNMDGQVVGVNTAILSPTGGSIGIGFSMAANVVSTVIDQLKEFGETRRGWLGVVIQDVTPDMSDALGLDEARGALVSSVPEGPAAKAGIEPGDVIVEFAGTVIDDTRELVEVVADTAVGKSVEVVVLRDGERERVSVTLGRRETATAALRGDQNGPNAPAEPQEATLLGLTLTPLTDEMREPLGVGRGIEGLVVTDVDPDSRAYEKGLRSGDVITKAGQNDVRTISALRGRIEAAREAGRKAVLLLIRRQGEPRFVALPITEE